MKRRIHGILNNERGIALLAVMVFIFIMILTAYAYFATSSYETEQAMYREESSEAFFLADGAVERARGELFGNGAWRVDTTGVAFGAGGYDLRVADTTLVGGTAGIVIESTGHVGDASRAIRVLGEGVPGLPPFLAANITVNGNMCLDGWAHANEDADFGNGDQHFNSGNCDGEAGYSEGFTIRPPIARTEPECYPEATYYYVDVVNTSPAQAKVYLADGVTEFADTSAAETLTGALSGSAPNFTFDLKKKDVEDLFIKNGGQFPIDPSDITRVVNFGESAFGYRFTVEWQGQTSDPVNATIINTKFIGATVEDRWDPTKWVGGTIDFVSSATLIPSNGIGVITHNFVTANAQSQLGSAALPGVLYVTNNVTGNAGQFEVNGAIIVLGDWDSAGGPDITFYPHIRDLFPECWSEVVFGQTVVFQTGSWREVAAE